MNPEIYAIPELRSDVPIQRNAFDLLSLIPSAVELERLAILKNPEYLNATPFPHTVLDGFLPKAAVEAALQAFPQPEGKNWYRNDRAEEKKLWSNDEKHLPIPIRNLLLALNSATFLTFLEQLTGIQGLIPDPYLKGGGMHQIVRGGHLGVHLDFNKYPKLKLERRINLLVYLNKNWTDSYGGHLELWKDARSGPVKKVLPIFNRCVIFTTSDTSYHGHPHPLECPEGYSRKSLALYYYTNGRPKAEMSFAHGTTFLDHNLPKTWKSRVQTSLRRFLREVTPPFLHSIMKKGLAILGYDK